MDNNTTKIILPMVIAVATLIVVVIGATYAYFSVTATNNFGTRTVTATAPSVGSVTLSTGSDLSMSLTAAQMMKKGSDTNYYAQSGSGKAATETATTVDIGSLVATSGTFSCDYTISVTATGTNNMYTAFQGMTGKSAGQIVLTVTPFGNSAQTLDFNTANLFTNKTITGTVTGVSTTAKKLQAQLKVVNKTSVDQTALAGKDITISFGVTALTCTATA